MKTGVFTFGVVALIIIIATLTNPNPDKHKEVVKNKLVSYLKQAAINNNNIDMEGVDFLFEVTASKELDPFIDNLVTTDNYVIFSRTKITFDGNARVIGIGAFGNVFLSKKLDDALRLAFLDK